MKQNYNNNNLIYIFIICRNLPENPDPYNDNEIKSNNIQKEEPEIDDNFFEEDFEINFTNVSKNTNSHNKNEEIKYIYKMIHEILILIFVIIDFKNFLDRIE